MGERNLFLPLCGIVIRNNQFSSIGVRRFYDRLTGRYVVRRGRGFGLLIDVNSVPGQSPSLALGVGKPGVGRLLTGVDYLVISELAVIRPERRE